MVSPIDWQVSPQFLPVYRRPVPGSPAMGMGSVIKCNRERCRTGGCMGRVTRRASEELSIIIYLVQYNITSEADTYVKVAGLPGWRRRKRKRKREKDQAAAVTQQSISWHKRHTTQKPDCHHSTRKKSTNGCVTKQRGRE